MSNQDEKSPTTPRWVKVFGAVALVVIAVFLVVHLMGGGFHGHH
ncbi:MAG: hypothetical protein ABI678_05445 [Kofleriaceae bacterium]